MTEGAWTDWGVTIHILWIFVKDFYIIIEGTVKILREITGPKAEKGNKIDTTETYYLDHIDLVLKFQHSI